MNHEPFRVAISYIPRPACMHAVVLHANDMHLHYSHSDSSFLPHERWSFMHGGEGILGENDAGDTNTVDSFRVSVFLVGLKKFWPGSETNCSDCGRCNA